MSESNGHDPARTATIDIMVSDRTIKWGIGIRDAEVRWKAPLEMRLTPSRRQTIGLLAELIRTSTDVNRHKTDLEQTPTAGGKSMLYDTLLKVTGHELFDLLFVGDLRSELSDQLVALRDGHCERLRVKLCFTGDDQEWLAMLPWEYARSPPGDLDFDQKGEFLSEVAELLLSRRIELRRPRELGRGQWPLRVLLVCSSPARAGEQQLAPVSAVRIVEQLEELETEGRIELRKLVEDDPPDRPVANFEPKVTSHAFKTLIQDFQPAIVHFIGHGQFDGTGRLAFSDVDGTVDWVDEWALRKHINASKDLMLVFLQACESALPDPYVSFSGVARTLAASGVPAVVGMQYKVTSATANAFACDFYDALLRRNLAPALAVQTARRELEDGTAFGLPVVYLASDADLGRPPAEGIHRVVALDRRDVPASPSACARCDDDLGSDDVFCGNCALRLTCEDCKHRYHDPLKDRFCRRCKAPVLQQPYAPRDIEPAELLPGGATDAARATLSVLRPRQVGGP
jgi:CHAT domain-containing protein